MAGHTLGSAPDELIQNMLDGAFEVHRHLGAGLLESAYEAALCHELSTRGMRCDRQVLIPVKYKGVDVGPGFRADIVVENCLLIELKCVDVIGGMHVAQVINYLRLLNIKRGFILNFHAKLMKEGIKRVSI